VGRKVSPDPTTKRKEGTVLLIIQGEVLRKKEKSLPQKGRKKGTSINGKRGVFCQPIKKTSSYKREKGRRFEPELWKNRVLTKRRKKGKGAAEKEKISRSLVKRENVPYEKIHGGGEDAGSSYPNKKRCF